MSTKPKGQAIAVGDVFLVSLIDASHCVGQVLGITKAALNSCICAFFDVHLPEGAREVTVPLNEVNLIAVQFVTPDLLKKGYWPVIDKRKIAVDVEKYIPLQRYEREGFVGAEIIGSGNIRQFLSAYYALRPWDNWFESDFLDKLLVSPDKRPANVILTKQ